jgi:hypothetical protein
MRARLFRGRPAECEAEMLGGTQILTARRARPLLDLDGWGFAGRVRAMTGR